MMNLEKMKQKKSKNSVKKGLLAATTILCLTSPMLQTQTAYAAENTHLRLRLRNRMDGNREKQALLLR